jgi:hypothetical protein
MTTLINAVNSVAFKQRADDQTKRKSGAEAALVAGVVDGLRCGDLLSLPPVPQFIQVGFRAVDLVGKLARLVAASSRACLRPTAGQAPIFCIRRASDAARAAPARIAERDISRLSLAPRLIEGLTSGPYTFLMRTAPDWYGLLTTS